MIILYPAGAFYGMKAVLSFHHSSSKTNFALPDADFLLVVPFVLVAHSNMSRYCYLLLPSLNMICFQLVAPHVILMFIYHYL